MPSPVLRCRDRHFGVKVEVSIRQRRFVGLIGHPHVFVPIMGLRAEGPAGLGVGKPGGPTVTELCSTLPHQIRVLHMWMTLTQFLEAGNCFL